MILRVRPPPPNFFFSVGLRALWNAYERDGFPRSARGGGPGAYLGVLPAWRRAAYIPLRRPGEGRKDVERSAGLGRDWAGTRVGPLTRRRRVDDDNESTSLLQR